MMLHDRKQSSRPPLRHSIPYQLLRTVSNRLRTACYDDFLFGDALRELKAFSERMRPSRNTLTEEQAVHYLWSLCLQAELYDYQADLDSVGDALRNDGPELEEKLNKDELGSTAPSKRLLRQQLWTLVFWSHRHYRIPDYPATRSMLRKIRAHTDKWLPLAPETNEDELSYGLRARIAYSLGQVHRQESDVAKAREEFMLAIEFTRKRLAAKRKKYFKNKVMLDQEQSYARYVIAKAFSFGLSWASYNSGELHRARCSAAGGCTLLETTGDPVHKAYSEVIYAGILSAKARPARRGESVEPELREAVSILRPLASTSSSPLRNVGRLLARARFTLAHALFNAGQFDEAERLARQIYQAETDGSPWGIECGVLVTRLLLERKDGGQARENSERLVKLVQDRRNLPKDTQVSVLLCHADVLIYLKDASYSEIHAILNRIGELAANNPLSMALWHLYRARCFGLQGKSGAAYKELANWEALKANIEHGYVLALADDVKQEIATRTGQLTLDPGLLQQKNGFSKAEHEFYVWVLRRLHAQFPFGPPSDKECKRILGRSRRQLGNWMTTIVYNPWTRDRPD